MSSRRVSILRSNAGVQRRALAARPLQRMVMCHSELIFPDVERTVEDAKNINVPVVLEQVCDSIVLVKQDAHVPRRCGISIAELRELNEILRSRIDCVNRASCGLRIILSDVLEYVFEPLLSLGRPRYLCHERIRRPISSFEIMRPASESASPRWIIT